MCCLPTSPLTDKWTRADVKRLARKVIGPHARVWVREGRCVLGVEAPARKVRGETPKGPPPRLVIAAAGSWAELVDRCFVKALESYEKAAAEGHVPTLEARREARAAELGALPGSGDIQAGEEEPAVTDPAVRSES